MKIGTIVKSIYNPTYTYRVVGSGHGWIYLVTHGGLYYRCCCRASILREVS